MSKRNTINKASWARIPRLAMLSLTLGGPVVRAGLERLRSRAASAEATVATAAQARQVDMRDVRDRLEELTQESRERVAQQIQHLRKQARQLQDQSGQLRKALQEEARQRQKYLKQVRRAGRDWSQDVWKRSEEFTGEIIERGQEISHDLAKRSRKATRELADLSEQALAPVRQHSRAWTFVGFGLGALIAGAITYRIVRGRAARRFAEDETIELSAFTSSNGSTAHPAHPAPTIRHFDMGEDGVAVAVQSPVELTSEELTLAERPDGAVYVGVISTKHYYPIDTELEAIDLVYFLSEEEARKQGFTAPAE
ncbi:MAG TPA: hypothetical protein VKT25_01195 [Ktedonobacteraceae bacterium]|nr:hypothetical protein [Ktedonobacteraceae bacterium]